jgi:hypothetical protein
MGKDVAGIFNDKFEKLCVLEEMIKDDVMT